MLPPERYAKAVAYARARYRLHFLGFAYSALLLVLLLSLRLASKVRDWAETASSRRVGQAALFVLLFTGAQALLELPLGVARHRLALHYEQSVQGWGSWLGDWLKGAAVGLLIGVLLVWGLYALLRRNPRRWWLFAWLFSLPLILLFLFLFPLVVDPLFFDYEPLAPRRPELAAHIEKLTVRAGIPIPQDRIFEMEASTKLRSVNASVTGFGASKRVVVWDTTIERLTPAQTLFVFGHEMGHYVLHHLLWGAALTALGLLVGLFMADRGARWALSRWGERWRIRSLSDWASLPVFLLAATLLGELAQPIGNAVSRRMEHAADIYALEVLHGVVPDVSETAAGAFQALGEINLSDPSPSRFIELWLYSHPPLAKRLAFARSYDPWSRGEKPRYLRASSLGKLELSARRADGSQEREGLPRSE